MKIICCLYLLPGVFWDIKTRYLPAIYIWFGFFLMAILGVYQIIVKDRFFVDLLISVLPGSLAFLLAKTSKNMGKGDAWLILILGLAQSFYDLINLLLIALFLSAIGSIVIVIYKRQMKNLKIPFVPFLFLGAVIVLLGDI